MRRWVQNSLVLKIALPTVALVLAVGFASAGVIGYIISGVHQDAAEQQASRFGAAVVAALGRETAAGHAGVQRFIETLCGATDRSALVTTRDGRVALSCQPRLIGSPIELKSGTSLVVDGQGQWVRRVQRIENTAECATCHAHGEEQFGFVAVDIPMGEELAEVRGQQKLNLVSGAITAVVLAVLLVLVHLGLVYRPVKQLATTVERIRRGDLGARTTLNQRDELGRLAQSLNEMAASIERAEGELGRTHRAELAQSEKLAALGQLLTSVAHEIKNQLAGVIGALKVVTEDLPPGEAHKAVLAKILSQMERMTQTVVTAMEFARPLKPAVVSVDLAEVLDRAVFFVERQATEQNVKIHTRYTPNLPHALIDEDLMKQVFLNVMLNGVQAMLRGGTLEVETRAAGPRAVEVVISDQGVGIAPEHRERIFSPFFSTKARGTGLGLYVARQIVETQQGEIAVESRPGQGTSFTIRLPADAAEPEAFSHAPS